MQECDFQECSGFLCVAFFFKVICFEVGVHHSRRLIGKAIIFSEVNKIFNELKLGSYKANVVPYVISWLSYKTNKKINLDSIWGNQAVSNELIDIIQRMIGVVLQHITTPIKAGMNVTDWYKKQECWITLRDKFIDVTAIEPQLITNEDLINGTIIGQYSSIELENIEKASGIKSDIWFQIAKWAKENQKLTAFDRKLAYNIGALINRKIRLSPKQAKVALAIYEKAFCEGFSSLT